MFSSRANKELTIQCVDIFPLQAETDSTSRT